MILGQAGRVVIAIMRQMIDNRGVVMGRNRNHPGGHAGGIHIGERFFRRPLGESPEGVSANSLDQSRRRNVIVYIDPAAFFIGARRNFLGHQTVQRKHRAGCGRQRLEKVAARSS